MSQQEFRKWYLRRHYRKNVRKAKAYQYKYNQKKRKTDQQTAKQFKSAKTKRLERITQHHIMQSCTEKSHRWMQRVIDEEVILLRSAALR